MPDVTLKLRRKKRCHRISARIKVERSGGGRSSQAKLQATAGLGLFSLELSRRDQLPISGQPSACRENGKCPRCGQAVGWREQARHPTNDDIGNLMVQRPGPFASPAVENAGMRSHRCGRRLNSSKALTGGAGRAFEGAAGARLQKRVSCACRIDRWRQKPVPAYFANLSSASRGPRRP